MVDWSDWIHWNTETALLYTIISVSVWVILQIAKKDEALRKVKHPKLVGISISLLSCFDLGLYAIVPMFNFLLISYVLEYWVYKYNSKNEKDKREINKEVVENFN